MIKYKFVNTLNKSTEKIFNIKLVYIIIPIAFSIRNLNSFR